MKRTGGHYTTSVRALDGRNVFILRWPGSETLMLGVTSIAGEGSAYISTAALRKLRDDIGRHLHAIIPPATRRREARVK